ncbi:MAG TPA: hypothetical protein GXZ77_08180 [Papillibacter sp.]|nr:hypothetical protein [Papillibacter sp.]
MPRRAKSIDELVADLEAEKQRLPNTSRGRLRKLVLDNEIQELRNMSDRRGE